MRPGTKSITRAADAPGYVLPKDFKDPDAIRVICRKAAREWDDGTPAYTYHEIMQWWNWNPVNRERKLTEKSVVYIVNVYAPLVAAKRRPPEPKKKSVWTKSRRASWSKAQKAQAFLRRMRLERLKARLGPMPEIPPNRTAPNGKAKKLPPLEPVDQVVLDNPQSSDEQKPVEPSVAEDPGR